MGFKRKLIKGGFNPNEPRDTHGRWTAGSSDSKSSIDWNKYLEAIPRPVLIDVTKADLPPKLYHATVNLDGILKSGHLRPNSGMNNGGLGGPSWRGPVVSMTDDPEMAEHIARELKRAVKIAHGEIDIEKDLLTIAREDAERLGVPVESFERAARYAIDDFYLPNIPPLKRMGAWETEEDRRKFQVEAYTVSWQNSRSIAAREHGVDAPSPGFYGSFEAYKRINPDNVGVVEVTTADIPDDAKLSLGTDFHLKEVRSQGDKTIPVAGALKKSFNPSQPRDERGRWTSGRFAVAPSELAGPHVPNAEHAKLIDAAVRVFGKTKDPREAGWLLPDGTFLDFSGRSEYPSVYVRSGDRFIPKPGRRDELLGRRVVDHSSIAQAYDDAGADIPQIQNTSRGGMYSFLGTGAIRMSYLTDGPHDRGGDYLAVHMGAVPTEQQMAALKDLANGAVSIDISDPSTANHLASFSEDENGKMFYGGKTRLIQAYNEARKLFSLKKSMLRAILAKFNPNHDERGRFAKRQGARMSGIEKEAAKYNSFGEFEKAYQNGMIGQYWHITDSENFVVDPNLVPSEPIEYASGDSGLFVTPVVEQWRDYTKRRKFAAELDLGNLTPDVDYKSYPDSDGRQIWITQSGAKKVKVKRTIPVSLAQKTNDAYWRKLPQSAEELEAIWTRARSKASGLSKMNVNHDPKTGRFTSGPSTNAAAPDTNQPKVYDPVRGWDRETSKALGMAALKHFGKTTNPKEAGFILGEPRVVYLDLSGKHDSDDYERVEITTHTTPSGVVQPLRVPMYEYKRKPEKYDFGEYFNRRNTDHGEAGSVFEDAGIAVPPEFSGGGLWADLWAFMHATDSIRIDYGEDGLLVCVVGVPGVRQLGKLSELADGTDVTWDIIDPHTGREIESGRGIGKREIIAMRRAAEKHFIENASPERKAYLKQREREAQKYLRDLERQRQAETPSVQKDLRKSIANAVRGVHE